MEVKVLLKTDMDKDKDEPYTTRGADGNGKADQAQDCGTPSVPAYGVLTSLSGASQNLPHSSMVGATNMATIITTNGNANPNVNGSINAHTVVTVPTSMRSAGSDQQQDQGTFDDFDELGDNTGQDQGDSGGAYGMW